MKNVNEKILLALLPYWTPQIPPMGLSSLKGFLKPRGFDVKTVDCNVEEVARKMYNKYFDAIREFVSVDKRGNFYNIGHEVLQNHMMAHINQQDDKEHVDLVKILIEKTFFVQAGEPLVRRLNELLDTFYQWLEGFFLNLLEKEKPSVLGLSVYKGSLPASLFVLKLTRKHHPHIRTVMGGAVFAQTLMKGTHDFERFLEKTKSYLDKIIIGEGELLFLKLLRGQLPESRRVFTLEDLDDEVLDLAETTLPDFSDFTLRFYPNLASYSSRSCPFQCSFCTETMYWGTYRKKDPALVADQLAELYKLYNTQLFLMCDSLLNPVVTGLAEEFIRRDLSLYWDGYLKVDRHSCRDERTLLWRRGGFYRARLGLESGSQRILDAMEKKISIAQVKATLTSLAKAGIKTTTY
ncbi:MAG: radical SAM protein, partial [bacterium]|nr:radical SAM protein [bacterium]